MSMVIKVTKENKSEFMMDFNNTSVSTCKHIKDAMVVDDIDFGLLSNITNQLYMQGYTCDVVEYKGKGSNNI